MYRKIGDDTYVVYFQDDFYTVNEYTLQLIQLYLRSDDTEGLAKLLCCDENDVEEIFTELNDSFENAEFNDKLEDLPFPLHVKWKITSRCNIRCKHCYIGEKQNLQLPAESNMEIARKIVKSGAFVVTISGGEPLTVDELPKIVAYLMNNGLELHIFTNGIILPEFITRLEAEFGSVKKNMLEFIVSLDGLREVHDFMRGEGVFDKTTTGMKYAINRGYCVKTNTTVIPQNIDDIPRIIEFCQEIGVSNSQFSSLINRGWAAEHKDQIGMSADDQKRFVSTLQVFTAEKDRNYSVFYSPLDKSEKKDDPIVYQFVDGEQKAIGRDTWKCGAGKGKCVINERGDVLCCPFFEESKIGNILKNDFTDFWKSPLRTEFINRLKQINGVNRYCAVMKGDCNV
ncbi:radical SAM protein [Anaerocolumna sp. MB42-C2]|uniref:radical SAM protein n=1 Tax=Anaerocolumna sp. MB42-C2 TaxID=3070997 RepID=UPI0027E0E61D|nr:radical SAM protein [Anaerocolumna sp. MB42-C2]WMJ86443.1 radical SAM protein [Anaerocolumna sp. MB42-C2]